MAQKILLIGILSLALIGCAVQGTAPEKMSTPVVSKVVEVNLVHNVSTSEVLPETESVEDPVLTEPEVFAYLEDEFCQDDLCNSVDWSRWVILDHESTWTINDLTAIREAILLSKAALEDIGLDMNQIFEGYRFERYNDFYLSSGSGRYAALRHDQQRIVLADQAFRRSDRFPILHEMGHVVDYHLDRVLSESYHDLASEDVLAERHQTAEGFWFRPQSAKSQTEATADAFALWVIMNYGKGEIPYFPNASRDADYESIQKGIAEALHSMR